MRLLLALLLCLSAGLQCVRADADFESVRTGLLRKSHNGVDRNKPEKYFHESTFHSHYDGRFSARQLPYDERRSHLTALVQTYLSTMRDVGAETWLMHGSLLGWWWNRKIMPWDSDIDVQVSERSMHHLASGYNMTVHHFAIPGVEGGRDYLLEINPRYLNASTADKQNVIDGRWIDTSSGLFIDITTLRPDVDKQAQGDEDAMMCKDKHRYRYGNIFPLREGIFENVPVRIPFAYAELLIEEYGTKSLTETVFEGHRFDPEKQEWILLSCVDLENCDYYRGRYDVPTIQEEDI